MILRGISVEHWRCIRKLELADLPEGIIVLHGPNGTGKSSLVQALRCCLFDFDHDSGGKEIAGSAPRNGEGPPRVTVEFTTGGVDYRIAKAFSKKKDGMALLEKKVGGQWRTDQDAPKEASRRTHELLGADKSDAGLNQLLWLSQGEIRLPEYKKVDANLRHQLEGVLGVMVTGRDQGFRQALEKRCTVWFTPVGRPKGASPLSRAKEDCDERLEARDEKKRQWDEVEEAVRHLQTCEEDLPRRRKALTQAEAEVGQLLKERQKYQERLGLFKEANRDLENAKLALLQAETRLQEFHEAKNRLQKSQEEVVRAKAELLAAQQDRDEAERQHQVGMDLLAGARQAEVDHQRGSDEIQDRRTLLTIGLQLSQIEKSLEAVDKLEAEIAKLEEQLQTSASPDKKTLETLRENRRLANDLRAQLRASELTLSVTLQQQAALDLSLDGQQSLPLQLEPGRRQVWPIRQRAKLTLHDFGTIEVGRVQEDLDLERSVQELAKLDRDYADAVRSFQENPDDSACLDRLADRRITRDNQAKRLKDTQSERAQLTPEGKGDLESERTKYLNLRLSIVERWPEWSKWQPNPDDVEMGEKQFKERLKELETKRQACEAAEKESGRHLQLAESEVVKKKEKLSASVASETACTQEIGRLEDEKSLMEKVQEAKKSHEKAEKALVDNQLTEEEKTIDQRLEQAETARVQRTQSLREVEDEINRLRGILQGKEGLHPQLADAEGALNQAESALVRETLESEAHKRLRDLFDDSRESQVQQVMGPVAGRVLEWSRKIGLSDCQEICFGDQFLPEGLMVQSDPSKMVSLDEESYGTLEQLSLLVRLALGGVLARDEPAVAILDDPLTHADSGKHRRILDVLHQAAEGGSSWNPPAGRLQILILTCHPDRFDHLTGAKHIDLASRICQ